MNKFVKTLVVAIACFSCFSAYAEEEVQLEQQVTQKEEPVAAIVEEQVPVQEVTVVAE